MDRTFRWGVLAAALLVTASCATVTGEKAKQMGPEERSRQIAALDRAITGEQEDAKLAKLLFERGHAYLDAAEGMQDERLKKGKGSPEAVEFARLMLGALRDFEDVAANFPRSDEAPEALFHLGVIYDYPNLMSFGIALKYYRDTIERYPGTESARKAHVAIENLEDYMHEVGKGRHGVQ